MLKRLEREATRADLAAVEALLAERNQDEDPVGWFQFMRRRDSLQSELAALEQTPTTGAAVGLFFGGRPVIGSRGIQADFGAKAVEEFQMLISSTFAAEEGPVGARGPLRQRDRAHLFITDVARGSFGFILEETSDEQLLDTTLKGVVGNVVDVIYRVASPDEEAFESVVESADDRILASLRSFFKVLDDAGATVRMVEEEREFTLQRGDIELGRERTETLTFNDKELDLRGAIYLLPKSRRFELHPEGGAPTIKGAVDPQCLEQLTAATGEVKSGIIGTIQNVKLRDREIYSTGREPKHSYLLISVGGNGLLGLQWTSLLPPR